MALHLEMVLGLNLGLELEPLDGRLMMLVSHHFHAKVSIHSLPVVGCC